MNTFLLPLLGGVLLGLGAALLLLFNGRIAGISGIAGGLWAPASGDTGWRVAFIGGLMLGGVVLAAVRPEVLGAPVLTGVATPLIAGLCVGFGARLGSGCTSGHGVCGLARGSKRSLVATLTFMAAGAATVFVTRHLVGGAS
ncbi:YeeE/YedE family protein [Myxococcus sp. MISCRS1]|uniref:YeeE/YedE family protein n=1 Tax=Myxococcus sp. MISCRS1 TaxID=2996786 RepID=UPI00226F39E0|nr:YeeE/YedE family protein [Myxococcus sp. MISCRS1]MCY1001484.1 YeeE/YedE family protein [Myxococcus sp. MISCRS1]